MQPPTPTLKLELPDGLTGAGPGAWKALGAITAEAFREDPVTSWIMGKEPAMRAVFSVLARQVYTQRGICYLAKDEGATMWLPPGSSAVMGPWGQLQLAVGLAMKSGIAGVKRALVAGETMDAHHPKDPHVYLFTIGVTETARGKGLGRKLMAPMLDACDRAGLPIYLENTNPANSGFYRSHGFKQLEMFTPAPGAPELESMWRDV